MLSRAPLVDPERVFAGIDLAGRESIVAAVSGGGDSLALLLLLKAFVDRRADAPRLLAVTIDHGLRAESASEAAAVARLCAERGIAHRILAWRGGKPATGLSAAARAARYRLLAEAAEAAGTDIVLTAHTSDDQAETVAMRAARGSGRGVAGIAPATLHEGRVWFARPLLGTRRADLRAFLREAGVAWINDPSNRDMRFERARTRRDLDDPAVETLAERAVTAAGARAALGRRAAALIAAHASRPAPGLIRLEPEFAAGADDEAAVYALRILLAVAGGRAQLPDAARTANLLGRLGKEPLRASLSRAVVERRRGAIHLHREARNLPVTALGEAPAIWDGRYRVSGAVPGDLSVGPLGHERADMEGPAVDDTPARLPRAALAAEPALWRGATCLGPATAQSGLACTPVAGPWALLMPSFDLAPARAASALVGAGPVPAPPLAGHIIQ